jgi:hypothetical protein
MADPAQSAEQAMVRVPRQNAGQCGCRVSRAVVGGGRLLTRLAVIVVRAQRGLTLAGTAAAAGSAEGLSPTEQHIFNGDVPPLADEVAAAAAAAATMAATTAGPTQPAEAAAQTAATSEETPPQNATATAAGTAGGAMPGGGPMAGTPMPPGFQQMQPGGPPPGSWGGPPGGFQHMPAPQGFIPQGWMPPPPHDPSQGAGDFALPNGQPGMEHPQPGQMTQMPPPGHMPHMPMGQMPGGPVFHPQYGWIYPTMDGQGMNMPPPPQFQPYDHRGHPPGRGGYHGGGGGGGGYGGNRRRGGGGHNRHGGGGYGGHRGGYQDYGGYHDYGDYDGYGYGARRRGGG